VVRTVANFVLAVAGGGELCWAKAQSVLPARIAAKQHEPLKLNTHALFAFATNGMRSIVEIEERETIQGSNAGNGGINQEENL
jgi:hypothetical protein